MAQLPTVKRLSREDFSDQPWISKLLEPLNQVFTSLYDALNKRLTIADNHLAIIKTMTVRVPGGSEPYTEFPWPFVTNPIGCQVINAVDISDSPAAISGAVCCAGGWNYSQGVVTVSNITGLTPGQKYSITFHVIGG